MESVKVCEEKKSLKSLELYFSFIPCFAFCFLLNLNNLYFVRFYIFGLLGCVSCRWGSLYRSSVLGISLNFDLAEQLVARIDG